MPEALDLGIQGFDVVFNRCGIQVPPAGFHVEKQVLPLAAGHPVYPDIGKVHIAQDNLKGGMGEHIVYVQPFLQPGQVFRLVQVILLAEIAQLKPVFIIPVLKELVCSCPGQDINIVNIRFLCHTLIGRHKVLVDLFPQVVVSPVPAVDINLDHFMILVQDILSLRQAAGYDIPQARGGKVTVGRPQQQALISDVIPCWERVEHKLIRAPSFPGIQGDALLAVDPCAVAGAGHGACLADFLFSVFVEILNMNRILISFGVIRNTAGSLRQYACFLAEQVFVI